MKSRLKNKKIKKYIPQKMILCHGRKCRKYSYLNDRKKILYLDYYHKTNPDILANIHYIHKFKSPELKAQFQNITSLHAPLPIFFNKSLTYLDFTSQKKKFKDEQRRDLFFNKNKTVSVTKILNSKYYFNRNFILSLLYLLKIGGEFEFTDNFIFESNMSDINAIKIMEKMLGHKSKFFNIYVSKNSNCIDYQQKAREENLPNKFIIIKKIKEYF